MSLLTEVRDRVNDMKNAAQQQKESAAAEASSSPVPRENGVHQHDKGSDSAATAAEMDDLKDKNRRLEDEVVHYQDMLKQTENLLSTLQVNNNYQQRITNPPMMS